MPADYGRAGAQKAQKGRGVSEAYRTFKPRNVEERLTSSELEEYRAALGTLASPAQVGHTGALKRKYLQRQQEAMSNASRLRELAASRAFGDFSAESMQYSKPWLMQQPSEGLVRGQTVAYGLANRRTPLFSFAGEGVRAAGPQAPASMMGEYEFNPIGYQQASQARRRRRRLAEIPGGGASFAAPGTSAQATAALPIDLGNFSFGRF